MFAHLDECDVLFITTNSTLRNDGALVMGRGAAYQAKVLWPMLPFKLGAQIKTSCGSGGDYLVLPGTQDGNMWIEAFQVKRDWQQPADPDLITRSTMRLAQYARKHPNYRIFLNCPGIGNGQLTLQQVVPVLAMLPSNVTIWIR